MVKKRLVLDIDGELAEEAEYVAERGGVSLGSVVEEYLEYLVAEKWLELLARELNLGELEPTSENEIPSTRPIGLDAANIVRELRNGRARKLTLD